MTLTLDVQQHFAAVDPAAYADLWSACGAPAFYHPAFLRAAETFPLLPVDGCYYLTAKRDGRLEAFLAVYRQRSPDPFGTLARSTGLRFDDPRGALLGHVAHCYETRMLVRPGADGTAALLLARLKELALELDVACCGLINFEDPALLAAAGDAGFAVKYMHDRYFIDLRPFRDFDDFVAHLPGKGRREMLRQLRKFESEGGWSAIQPATAADLTQVAHFCHVTSAKNGTPQYYPEATFRQFVATCSELTSIIAVGLGNETVATAVCLHQPDRLHIWSGGLTYERSEFSPYSVLFAHGIQRAFAAGLPLIEAGRTNPRIKARLGCTPKQLYSAIFVTPAPANSHHPAASRKEPQDAAQPV